MTLQHVAAKIVRGTFYRACMLILFIICGRVSRAGHCGRGRFAAVLTASSGACGGQNDSKGYCRVSSHETNDVFHKV